VLGVCLITAGRLGDIYGPRNMFIAGTALFTLSSALCGLSSSPGLLIAARALQGAGAALLTPQPLAIVLPLFPPESRGAAFSVNGVVAGVAAISGPTLGGLIVTHWDWRGIFFVNVPVGIFSIALTFLLVPDLRPGRRHRLDISGVVVATIALTAITFGLIEGQRYHWGTIWGFVTIPLLFAFGFVLLGAFFLMQRRLQTGEREPLVPFALFRDRNYTLMVMVGAAMQFGLSGLFLPFTIYLQSVLGLSALQAGLVYVPSSALSMVLTPFVGRLVDRVGGKYILMGGLSAFALGMLLQDAVAGVGTSRWAFVPGVIISGVGLSGIFVPMITVAMTRVQPRLAGAASGLINTTRQLGGVIGAAAVGAVLQNRLAAGLRDEAVARAHTVPAPARDGFLSGFRHASQGGLDVGAGQAGSAVHAPPGTPPEIADRVGAAAAAVFRHGFVDALHPTLALPAAVLLVAAVTCFLVRGTGRPDERPVAQPAAEPAPAAA
jgi:EmrB/QacA subfamily drug resistance transporter